VKMIYIHGNPAPSILTPFHTMDVLFRNTRSYAVYKLLGMPKKPIRSALQLMSSFCMVFSERQLRYVRYMPSPVRLSSVCLLSVTLERPTQPVEIFGNFFTV